MNLRKRIISTIFVIALIAVSATNIYQNHQDVAFSDLALENINALADPENENGEKIYRYQVWNSDVCYVLVGGAYAKGKKVSCLSGNEHPVCVDCTL